MTPSEIETYLHDHIPLSAAMGVQVFSCGEDGVTLTAPLAPNINHRATAFGGSVSAVAILSAWTWLHLRLRAEQRPSRLVIQRNTVDYHLPVTGAFRAECRAVGAEDFARFRRAFDRHGRGRLTVTATIHNDAAAPDSALVAATFSGEFVALAP